MRIDSFELPASEVEKEVEKIVKLYVKYGNINKVSKIYGIPPSSVKEAIIRSCGPLHRIRSVCRAYLALKDYCVISVKELALLLNIKQRTAIHIAKKLTRLVKTYRLVALPKEVLSIKRIPLYYIVKNNEVCKEEFKKRISTILGSYMDEVIEWI